MNDRPSPKPSREEVAKAEIGRTDVSPPVARLLMVCFLGLICIVPMVQHVREVLLWQEGWRASPVPEAWDIFRHARRAVREWRRSDLDLWERTFTVNRTLLRDMEQYEDRLEENSWLTEYILSPAQYMLARYLRAGNEKTTIGNGNWLYYRPAVEYLTGPGFLASVNLEGRTAWAGSGPLATRSDPIGAILHFREQLAARGVELILVPVPPKASVHPEGLAPTLAGRRTPLQNCSYGRFIQALTAQGVRVIPADELLIDWAGTSGAPAYLATDTHWTPGAMEAVARHLARVIEPLLPLPARQDLFVASESTVENLGDLGVMLKLPPGAPWPPRESVPLRSVLETASGLPWAPDPTADVLVLGDSYTNIYSLESMGWGTGAGFAEHLGLALHRPVDAIVRNDAGAYATRELLSRDLASGRDRLAGKKVVVWQFAARELAQGDWKRIDLISPPPPLEGPSGVRALTGTWTRVVWTQALDPRSLDEAGRGDGFRLMGLDTEDGLGIREILPGPMSCRKPLLTADGRQIVFTDAPRGKIMAVHWDGSGLRELADGYATDVAVDPESGRHWVYAVQRLTDERDFSGRPVVRFDLEQPWIREMVWDATDVTVDNFQVSADGSRAAGQFPWPEAAVLDVRRGTLTRLGRGCWTSHAPDDSFVAWVFDGAHRNLLMQDGASGASWSVPLHRAPNVGGYEVYHPRWSNHRRFFAMTGPYKGGEGDNRIGAVGEGVEIYVGRFSEDLTRVERWARVTADGTPDFFPDVWIDPSTPPAFDPSDVDPPESIRASTASGPIEVEARLRAVTRVPSLESIAPYRQALVVYAYDVLKVFEGGDPGARILVHHWAVRNERPVPIQGRVGDVVRLSLEPFESRPDLQGERVVSDLSDMGWPMYVVSEAPTPSPAEAEGPVGE